MVTAALRRPFAAIPPARLRAAATSAVALFAIVFPLIHPDDADVDATANALSYAALALGLNIVVGMAGLLDLGYAAFFAIGAYCYGILSSFQLQPEWSSFWEPFSYLGLVARIPGPGTVDVVHTTLSFWLAIPLSGALAAGCGILFGAPTLRLRGDYLAIVTLGFGEIVPIIARNWTDLTNGAAGLNGVAPPSLGGTSFGVDALPYYYVIVAIVAALIFISIRLRDSRIGRAWMAIREDEIAAGAMGVNLVRFKLLAFAIGASFAGMTGTFYVAKLQTATPEMFGFPVSVMILVMVVLGGMGSVWGVVLGAMILQLLQSWFLQDLTQWCHMLGEAIGNDALQRVDLVQSIELIFGIILVLMMLYRREGLIPAHRKAAALTFEQQHAVVERGSIITLPGIEPPKQPGVPLLQVKGVTVRFGGLVALNAVDIMVPEGGVLAVIGPNGSGKSTLFNTITGLTPAASGSITFAGQELVGLPSHRILQAGLARTFQNIRLFPNLSVMDNVLVGQHSRLHSGAIRSILRLPATKAEERLARERVMEILALFGNRLTPRVNQPVSGLSYANRRRVEIARALASGPRLLMLDEPTAGMNPAETLELAEQLKQLHTLGLSILVIEHKLDVVVRLADKVVVLDHGEKLTEGLPDEVRRNEAVLDAYLGRSHAAVEDAIVA
jgi:branched-chain amino acid transport system permease protein